VRFVFAYDGGGAGKGGTGTLLVDGKVVAKGRLEKTVPGIFTPDETFDVGMDLGTPVGAYRAPFKFNGTIKKVTLDTSPNAIKAK
jgi:arylsulfatase